MGRRAPNLRRAVLSTASPERLLTAAEVAELLGFSAATILDWFEAGTLPGFKINGRAVRFRASEVEAWIVKGRRGPDPSGDGLSPGNDDD